MSQPRRNAHILDFFSWLLHGEEADKWVPTCLQDVFHLSRCLSLRDHCCFLPFLHGHTLQEVIVETDYNLSGAAQPGRQATANTRMATNGKGHQNYNGQSGYSCPGFRSQNWGGGVAGIGNYLHSLHSFLDSIPSSLWKGLRLIPQDPHGAKRKINS